MIILHDLPLENVTVCSIAGMQVWSICRLTTQASSPFSRRRISTNKTRRVARRPTSRQVAAGPGVIIASEATRTHKVGLAHNRARRNKPHRKMQANVSLAWHTWHSPSLSFHRDRSPIHTSHTHFSLFSLFYMYVYLCIVPALSLLEGSRIGS